MVKAAGFFVLLALLAIADTTYAAGEGSTSFIARPRIGAAKLTLPSQLSWQSSTDATGAHLVTLSLVVDVNSVLTNIRSLSAAALDKAKPCGDTLKVRDASAKLINATTIGYDLQFHYAKRLCVSGGPSLDLPADIACSSIIKLSGKGATLTVDIRGASLQPCAIDGSSAGIAQFAAKKVFKRHVLDLGEQLPPEFQGVSVSVRSLAFDTPPAAPRLRITGEASMSDQEFAAFEARARATTRGAHR